MSLWSEPEYDPQADDADHWHDARADREADAHHHRTMQIKRYYENLLHLCSEEQTGQDAVEWAIVTGLVTLTFDREADLRTIMAQYSALIEAYQAHLHREAEHTWAEGLAQKIAA